MVQTLSLAERRQRLTIVWLAMMASVVVYAVAGVAVSHTVGRRIDLGIPDSTLLLALPVVSAVPLGASFWWRRLTLIALLDEDDHDASAARYQTVQIACWAISEIPAVVGLVLTLLTSNIGFTLMGSAIALLWIAMAHRPAVPEPEEAGQSHSTRSR